jgi:hypothetical protein
MELVINEGSGAVWLHSHNQVSGFTTLTDVHIPYQSRKQYWKFL